MRFIITFFLIFISPVLYGQCPTSDFTIPGDACIEELFEFTNTSSAYDSLYWDFCSTDLQTAPTITTQTISELNEGWGYKLIHDSNSWYGFIASRNNNQIIRLDFGSSLDATPTIVPLGNIDNSLNSPEGIDIIKNGGNWYGFVPSLTSSYGIVKLEFGNSLSNTPTATNIGNFGYTGRIREAKVVNQGGDYILVLLGYESKKIIRINFRDSFENTINPSDIYESMAITDAVNSIGIQLINNCGNWKALETSITNEKIIQLDFGSDILSEPTIDATYSFSGITNPRKIDVIKENGEYYALVANASSNMSLINFHDLNIANTPTEMDNSTLEQFISVGSAIQNGKKYVHGLNTTTNLYSIVFDANCGQNINSSNEELPFGIKYSSSGSVSVELIAFNSTSDYKNSDVQIISISSSSAPQFSSQITGNCLSSPISFEGIQNSGDITDWDWDFGDGSGTSTLQNDTYTYASAGFYQVKLNVTDANGCNNLLVDTVEVYEEPIPDFTYTAGNLCMNNVVDFTNTSTGETGSVVNWTWDFNGEGSSTTKDASFTFTTPGSKTIELKSSIPGCANVIQKTIFIEEAPTTDFSFDNVCNGQATTFTDLTTGENITTWNWDFGDGNSSTNQMPMHTYAIPGQYDVTLTVTNNTGCPTEFTQTVYNHNIPTVDFANDLACSTSPIQFTDQSLVENANLAAWEWDFRDGNTSTNQNPQHLFGQTGDFTVLLKAYSEYGCVDSIETDISVIQGPEVDFTWDKSCEGETTSFTDNTNTFGNVIDSWTWIMESTLQTEQNPTHTFNTSGIQPVQLSVTLANNCAQTLTQDIDIKPTPEVQFGYEEDCSDQSTTFYDLSDQTDDIIISREWRVDGQMMETDSTYSDQLSPGIYLITLTVITTSGCEQSTTNEVTLTGSPVASFTTNASYGAVPLTVIFTNASTGGNNYEWSFGDLDNSTSTNTNPEFTYDQIGSYTVTLNTFSEPDCFNEITQTIEVVEPETSASINAISPIINANKTNFVITIENMGTTTLDEGTNLIFRTNYGAEVVETLGQTIYAGRTNNYESDFALSSSSFADNLCLELFETNQSITLDRKCISLSGNETISEPYPNPSSGQIYVDVILSEDDEIQIRVINRSGQLQLSESFQGTSGLNQIEVAGEELSQGIYIVEVTANGNTQKSKINISR